MQRLLTWWLAVAAVTGNSLIISTSVSAPSLPPRWPCIPNCVCLTGGSDDVTRSRGAGLCVRSAEVARLSASRLASVTQLSISGEPPSTLLDDAKVHRQLSNVRRLQINSADGEADAANWTLLFFAFNRLNELTVRNSSSAAASALAGFMAGRIRPDLQNANLSEADARMADFRSLSSLSVLDVSGNSIKELANTNDSACIGGDDDTITSTSSSLNSTSGLPPPATETRAETGRCLRRNAMSALRVFNASRNQISVVGVGLFDRKSGRKLEHLDLSFNRLSEIGNKTFADLYALRSLNLSHNVIADVEVGAFAVTLDGDQSGWTIGAAASYQATSKQREAQYFISLASCTQGWLSIQVVDLSFNKLKLLRKGLLEEALCAVQRLILSNNKIDHLPRYLFEHLPYLTHLDLSNNAMAWLDVGTFTNPSLSSIDLSGNRLRKIVSMTFLYLPALSRVDLSGNRISYVYKFAFYRLCSDARRPIAVSLRDNELDVDAVWKLLTTFEHLENPGCLVDVDLRNNRIERFLAPETLNFVRKRLVAVIADPTDAATQLKHFRRWNHVTADLTGNRIHCDCTLAAELRTIDAVLEMIGIELEGRRSGPEADVITKSWRRLNCSDPVQHAGLSVGTFVDTVAPSACDSLLTTKSSLASYGTCSSTLSRDDLSQTATVNCSAKQLTQFPVTSSLDFISTELGVRTLDLSSNHLSAVRVDLLRQLYPALSNLLLHRNRITSLPVELVDGSLPLTSLTLAENPLVCDCAQPWLHHVNFVRLATIVTDWVDVKCADGRPLQRFTTVGYRCAGPTGSSRHPGTLRPIIITLGVVLAIAAVLTLIGLVVRLAKWLACGWSRRTKIYDIISVNSATVSGNKSTMVILVMYCIGDDEWVRTKLLPLLRQSTTAVKGVVRLSLKTIDSNRRQTCTRKFAENLRHSAAESQLAVVVISTNFIDEMSRRGDAVAGFLSDVAGCCIVVSPDRADSAAVIKTVRLVFGRDVEFVTSDDDIVERLRAEVTSSMLHQRQISRDLEDADQHLMNDEKY